MKPLLTLKNISFSYNNRPDNKTDVLDKINLTVNRSEIVSVLGPCGCGKSTLLAIICGLLLPEEGCIIMEGSHVGHMFSSGNLFEWITTYRNIYNCYTKTEQQPFFQSNPYPAKNLFRHDRNNTAQNCTLSCNRKNCLKRRAELIKTLSFEPELLLLDEPFLPFNADEKLMLACEIRTMLIKEQKTALLATNDINEALLFADKIILLTGKPASVCKQIEIPSFIHPEIQQITNQLPILNNLITSSKFTELVSQIQNYQSIS